MLNSEGGVLLIGIDDDGNILGVEKDYQTLSKSDKDGFELHLHQLIKNYLGNDYEKHIKISFPELDNKEICQVKILKNGEPVFLTVEGKQMFYVRNGNSSIPKSRHEQSEYEKIHWN